MIRRRQRYPAWIYSTFPTIFILVGFFLVIPVRNSLTAACGLALLAGGSLVWLRRDRYRRAFARSKGFIKLAGWADRDTSAAGHLQISWRRSFECGHPVLDAQHRRLFGLCSEIVAIANRDPGDSSLQSLVDEFIGHMREHFLVEEAVLARVNPGSLIREKTKHRAMLMKALDLRDRFRLDASVARELATFATYEVIVDHMAKDIPKLLPQRKVVSVEKPEFRRKPEMVAAQPIPLVAIRPLVAPEPRPSQPAMSIWDDVVPNTEKRRDSQNGDLQ